MWLVMLHGELSDPLATRVERGRDTIAVGGELDVMFGTVAKYRLKPGHEKQFLDEMGSFEGDPPAGWVYHTIFRSTKDPNEVWLSVVFESEEAYRKNAESPDMDKEYRKMLEHLQGDPEWHDGHVIHEAMRQQATS
jgi:quinol monooxygenase YgiN